MNIFRRAKQWIMAEQSDHEQADKEPSDAMDVLGDSAAQTPAISVQEFFREIDPPQPVNAAVGQTVLNPPAEMQTGISAAGTLPVDLMQAFGIHSQKEYDRQFRKFSSPEFWIGTLLELPLIAVLITYQKLLTSFLSTYLPSGINQEPGMGRIIIPVLTVLLIVHLLVRTIRHTAGAVRRRQVKKVFSILERKGYYTRSDVEVTVKTLFGSSKLFY